ncbi:microtubule-associated protein 4 isoform X2 [Ischnura elegans]|uniref:microtubule-associated protein 4 isoform X2 n=1 Tax=Ischnura elegans TaxID=197161 RepID=UPI001ED8BE97|nr:microtubule-associated protein 4 isoform X2 [Ischnura elegans]
MTLPAKYIFVVLVLIGFSVGDELGFKQSLSNLEGNRRRSTQTGIDGQQGAAVPQGQTDARSQRGAPVLPVTFQGTTYTRRTNAVGTSQIVPLPPFKPIPTVSSAANSRSDMVASASQGGKIAAAVASATQSKRRATTTTATSPSSSADISSSVIRTVKAPTLVAVPVGTATRVATVPAFQAMPKTSLSRSSDAGEDFRASLGDFIKLPQSTSQSLQRGVTLKAVAPPSSTTKRNSVAVKPDALSTRTLGSMLSPAPTKPAATMLTPTAIGQSMEAIAKASNVSVQTVASAIAAKLRRRQQTLEQVAKNANAGATATSQLRNAGIAVKKQPQRPKPSALASSRGRVMNAPREYYPVGYDKDFDDGFAARVDLPDTSFTCGNQKHFPGLYADEDLGCMVFHVCALTDEGMVMKSFLCPESTLFDQTILKCNWWFYVDCKASRKLYDSNIPVSKSYQLMKALAFFSSYKSTTS